MKILVNITQTLIHNILSLRGAPLQFKKLGRDDETISRTIY